jgi:hypothetical protein
MEIEERRPDLKASTLQNSTGTIAVLKNVLVMLTRLTYWAYVLAMLVSILAVWWGTDRWWLATFFAYGPTWIGLLPLLVLVPITAMLRARLLPVLLVVGGCYPFLVMGYCVPWPWQQVDAGGYKPITLLTCNIEGGRGGESPLRALIGTRVEE